MSVADETIAREYFETSGFLVRQLCKYQVQSRKKRADEELDFAVYNPTAKGGASVNFAMGAEDLKQVRCAVVSIKAWHTSLFTPALIKNTRDLFNFLKKPSLKLAEEIFPESGGDIKKIMVIPGLASAAKLRRECIEILKQNGVTGVLSYPAMLQTLADSIEVNNNYAKSELLQTLRILKNYGMIKSAQLELFK